YTRTESIFEGGTLKAEGLPSPQELALLEPLRNDIPVEAFGEAYVPPKSNVSGSDRRLLKQASDLLDKAGWTSKGGVRTNAKGERLTVEFLEDDKTFERVMTPYFHNLRLLGIDASVRLIDQAQFRERLKTYDFDIVAQRYVLSQTPGVELKAFFGSQAASAPGSYNLPGVASKAVDSLLDSLSNARNRDELETAG